ncbi:MAG: hypothetical protein ABJF50_21380 [Paracoccaceae bacterium]
MSTWTCKAAVAAFVLSLAGCEGGFDVSGFGVSRAAPDQISLPDGLVVAGAEGWCVDVGSSQSGGATSVVVLGSCAAIGRDADAPRPEVPGVMTVSVESAGLQAPPADALEAFFGTDDGLAVLARDGNAESVRLLESKRDGELLYLHAEDATVLPGTSPDYWRALFDLKGRLVSVTLLGIAGRPISSAEGLAALQSQIEQLIAANAA